MDTEDQFIENIQTLIISIYNTLVDKEIDVYVSLDAGTGYSDKASENAIRTWVPGKDIVFKHGNTANLKNNPLSIFANLIIREKIGTSTTVDFNPSNHREVVKKTTFTLETDTEKMKKFNETIEKHTLTDIEAVGKYLSARERREEALERVVRTTEPVPEPEIDPTEIELPESVQGDVPARSMGTLTQAAQIINSGNLSLDNIRTLSKIDPTLIGKLKEMKIKEILQDKTGTAEKRRDLADLKALRGFEQQLVVKEKIATPAPRRKADKMTKKVKMVEPVRGDRVEPARSARRKKQRRELRKSLSDF
jgi:hypothetical protein